MGNMKRGHNFKKAKRNSYAKRLPRADREPRDSVRPINARYVHTNLVARNWERLASFYETVFGCEPVPPARQLSGKELAAGTGVPNARILGIHLRLPGFGEGGPTLEIFQYETASTATKRAVNRPGFGHLAFAVEDVDAAREAVLAAGGSPIGDVVNIKITGAGRLRFAYVRDPEGNAIELQAWQGVRGH